MTRKNPDDKPLRIVASKMGKDPKDQHDSYGVMLSNLAIAQAQLAKHKSSAMPHFIAIVKEIERVYGFRFEQID